MFLDAIYICFLNASRDGDHHFPGQPIPMPDHSFSKQFFLNTQSKPPLKHVSKPAMAVTNGSLCK